MLTDTISIELFRNTEDWKGHGEIFLHDHFWMLHDFEIRDREFLFTTQPYHMYENRVVWVKQGSAIYSFNLVDYDFKAGDLVVFYADTLVEKKRHSPDFQFDAFRFDGIVELTSDDKPVSEPTSFIRLTMTEQMQEVVSQHFTLLWQLVHQQPFPLKNVQLVIHSLLLYAGRQHGKDNAPLPASRQQDTVRRFVALVSRYAGRERNIPFYADHLCLAPHYLSTLVKQVSGRTVMQWINETAVKEIKVWLAYSDETAAQISERQQFPSPASLSKFFRRETGMTPGEYRAQLRLGGKGEE